MLSSSKRTLPSPRSARSRFSRLRGSISAILNAARNTRTPNRQSAHARRVAFRARLFFASCSSMLHRHAWLTRIVTIALLSWLLIGIGDALRTVINMPVQKLVIKGREHTALTAILKELPVQPTIPLKDIDVLGISTRLAQHPLLDRVRVQRVLPDQLVVTLVERIPVASIINEAGEQRFVDAQGVLLPAPQHQTELPRFVSASPFPKVGRRSSAIELKQGLQVLQLWKQQLQTTLRNKPALQDLSALQIWIDKPYLLSLRPAQHLPMLRFPSQQTQWALRRFALLLKQSPINLDSVKQIDIHQPDRDALTQPFFVLKK